MKNRVWFYLCIIQTIALFAAVLFLIIGVFPWTPEPQTVDLNEYLQQFAEENNFVPDVGYIPDARTAKTVGSAIIEQLCGIKYGFVEIAYDRQNRLWRVERWNLFHPGAMVVIEQDSGKVIKALLSK